jgi:hypothetical protein
MPEAHNLEAIGRVTRRSIDWILRGEMTPEWSAMLAEWRETATGSRATEEQIGWIRTLPLVGYVPTLLAFDLALMMHERGLTPEQAATAIGENVTAADLNR